MDAEGEFVDSRTLAAKVEDTDLGVGHTTIEAGFGVWLSKMLGQHFAASIERAIRSYDEGPQMPTKVELWLKGQNY